MTRSSLPWLVVGAIVVAAALAWLTLTRGGAAPHASGNLQRYPLAPFHEIEIGGQADIVLIQDDLEAIEADVEGRGRVEANVADGRLTIHASYGGRFFDGLFGRRRTAHTPLTADQGDERVGSGVLGSFASVTSPPASCALSSASLSLRKAASVSARAALSLASASFLPASISFLFFASASNAS